jgi:hypothetical protein
MLLVVILGRRCWACFTTDAGTSGHTWIWSRVLVVLCAILWLKHALAGRPYIAEDHAMRHALKQAGVAWNAASCQTIHLPTTSYHGGQDGLMVPVPFANILVAARPNGTTGGSDALCGHVYLCARCCHARTSDVSYATSCSLPREPQILAPSTRQGETVEVENEPNIKPDSPPASCGQDTQLIVFSDNLYPPSAPPPEPLPASPPPPSWSVMPPLQQTILLQKLFRHVSWMP